MSFVPFHYSLALSSASVRRQLPPTFNSLVPSSSSSSSSSSLPTCTVHYQSTKSELIRISRPPPLSPPPPLLPLHPPPPSLPPPPPARVLTGVPPSGVMFSPGLLHPYHHRIGTLHNHHHHHDLIRPPPPPPPPAPPRGTTVAGVPYPDPGGGHGYGAVMPPLPPPPPPPTPGINPSAFYPPLNGESVDRWRTNSGHVTTTNAWSSFDPASSVCFPYGSYGGLDVRRKNATRESTSTLKAWLYEHIKNPYPTKGEKIMLAIITKMTLTQVSTWFANARRRLKKENKMQWSPRNRNDDDDDDDDDKIISDNDDNDEAGSRNGPIENGNYNNNDDDDDDDDEDIDIVVVSGNDDSLLSSSSNQFSVLKESEAESKGRRGEEQRGDPSMTRVRVSSSPLGLDAIVTSALTHRCMHARNSSSSNSSSSSSTTTTTTDPSSDVTVVTYQPVSTATAAVAVAMTTSSFEKPRIWSLADMATSGDGTLSQSVVSVHTADFRLLPPKSHVTASPCSYQPWTSAATAAARTLPVRDVVIVSDRRREKDAENDVIGVARGDRIFPGSTAETDWESNGMATASDSPSANKE